MNFLQNLKIDQEVIALFGSGNSLLEMDPQTLEEIYEEAFVITINYGPIHFKSHLNMWSDVHLTQFLDEHYQTHEKDRLFLARTNSVGRGKTLDLKDKIDFWFDPRKEKLRGNYTVVWALQLLRKYFPNKKVLLFGIDMYALGDAAKWYDNYTDFDRKKRGRRFRIDQKLKACADQLARFVGPQKNIINCNPKSQLNLFRKGDFRKHLHSISKPAPENNPQNPMRLLIKFPTRDRPGKFLQMLQKYHKYLNQPDLCEFIITADNDDPKMNTPEIRKKIEAFPNTRIFYGNSKSKIQAVNADMEKAGPWDILLLASDDMDPKKKGYDDIIRRKMTQHFPDTDGVLFFNDGLRGRVLNTLSIMGKRFYDRFGYIYHPDYISFYCDNEFTEVADAMGKMVYFPEVIIAHRHFTRERQKPDALYRKNGKFADRDRQTYEKRKAANYFMEGLQLKPPVTKSARRSSSRSARKTSRKRPETRLQAKPTSGMKAPKWSILVCTLESRRAKFARLKAKLEGQIAKNGLENEVEVLSFSDNRENPVGRKRNALIAQSNAEYICFVDDDDDVHDEYVSMIYGALQSNPDCVSLVGIITRAGRNPRKFIHSIEYSTYFERDNIYYRPPNHLNPIRRELAAQVAFPEIYHGEDSNWAMELCKKGLLKEEVKLEEPYYFYLFDPARSETLRHMKRPHNSGNGNAAGSEKRGFGRTRQEKRRLRALARKRRR